MRTKMNSSIYAIFIYFICDNDTYQLENSSLSAYKFDNLLQKKSLTNKRDC